MRALAAVFVLLLVSACQAPQESEFTAGDRAAIDELAARYLSTAQAADWDAWTELWTADAVYMNPDAPPLVGQAAIRESMNVFPDPPTEMSASLGAVDGGGKWAWARGSFVFAMAASGDMPEMGMAGSFLWVLEKQPDATWLIDSETYNLDIPRPPPPEG
jgi:ketosteroid isomerase-like protein